MSNITANVANVQIAGKGARYAEQVAAAVIAAMPDEYDWKARGAVPAAILSACGVTKKTAPKQKTGKAGEQVATDWGRGLDAVAFHVRKALKADDTTDKEPVLRANMKGLGSVVIPKDHPAYALVLALFEQGE